MEANFERVLRPSTIKTENCVKKILMVAYVHIEYSTYQFSEESIPMAIKLEVGSLIAWTLVVELFLRFP